MFKGQVEDNFGDLCGGQWLCKSICASRHKLANMGIANDSIDFGYEYMGSEVVFLDYGGGTGTRIIKGISSLIMAD